MFDGGVIIVTKSHEIVVIVTPIISFSSTEKLFGITNSKTMATIMLCGFANFASIGIQIGGIGILAPGKSKLLTELGFKAMIAGTLVSLLSATFVGMLLG